MSQPLRYYILGIHSKLERPHLLCQDTLTDPAEGLELGRMSFVSGFDGTLPAGGESGSEAVGFDSEGDARAFVAAECDGGSDWIYALWIPPAQSTVGTPARVNNSPTAPKWTTTAPESTGLYWWLADDESSPIVVEVDFCRTDESYFARVGQHGWTDPQAVTEMGGVWMPCPEPEPFDFNTLFN